LLRGDALWAPAEILEINNITERNRREREIRIGRALSRRENTGQYRFV
jgi:hypothetical protein